jgi:GAF domain-containing protein
MLFHIEIVNNCEFKLIFVFIIYFQANFMSDSIHFEHSATKVEKYQTILPQIAALLADETDHIANMANVSAVLKEVFSFWWVGFYIVKQEELVLGPFQGPLACTRIQKGKGVCGKVWATKQSIIVPDVDAFEGHIACSAASKSEIVIPLMHQEKVIAVLDVDSEHLHHFDEIDELYLSKIVALISLA